METDDELRARYEAAMHAMQSGVAMEVSLNGWPDSEINSGGDVNRKHLRVGVNSALLDSAAVINLLVKKQIISEREFLESIVEMAEAEVKRYEERLTKYMGGNTKITLA